MADDIKDGATIIEAHQELIERIERTASRTRFLAATTLVVAAVLALSYLSQLLLPLFGTDFVTVQLNDPGVIAGEVVVLALSLVWLYLGLTDYRFSSKMRAEIKAARAKEEKISQSISRD